MSNEGQTKLLEVRDLRTYFDVEGQTAKAVDGVSFDIYENEVFGLVGESGSGKTTLAKMLLGLLKPSDGDIYFQGQKRDIIYIQHRAFDLRHHHVVQHHLHLPGYVGISADRNVWLGCSAIAVIPNQDKTVVFLGEIEDFCGVALTDPIAQHDGIFAVPCRDDIVFASDQYILAATAI